MAISIIEAAKVAKARTNDKRWNAAIDLELDFCPACQTFHGTKEAHTCIR
jgi:hypothetical protein